jgi:hypothetical protein
VTQINLRGNLLHGKITKTIEYLDLLERLDFADNMITGTAVDFLSLFVNLKDVWLMGNPDLAGNSPKVI